MGFQPGRLRELTKQARARFHSRHVDEVAIRDKLVERGEVLFRAPKQQLVEFR